MNFSQQLKAVKAEPTNNREICKLQSQYESQAWVKQEIASKLKQAVKWLRENESATAQDAINKFFNPSQN